MIRPVESAAYSPWAEAAQAAGAVRAMKCMAPRWAAPKVKAWSTWTTANGANAVVNVRFSTSSVAQGAAELFAYGTAVLVR